MKAKDQANTEEKSPIASREEEILAFWQENKIFEKSQEKLATEEFVFYDGPPFATGLPHYGHILASTIKDAIPRFQTMKGKRVRRRWGWDCHGLPLENIVEAELGLKSKKDIEDFGIKKFNESARVAVVRFADDWKKIIPRLGRWVDMDNDYKTMDSSYTESVWWIFKSLYDQGLIYEGYKSMHICPRCETTLANFEVNQGYKDITDISVTIELELEDEPGTYLLAWTTTPWTLPGNVALAVNPAMEYVRHERDGKVFIVAKDLEEKVFGEKTGTSIYGAELVGKKYKPLFDYYSSDESLKNRDNGWKVYGADFVTMEEGTGIVHIAPAFGDDDYQLLLKENLPFVQHVKMDGTFKSEVKDFAGLPVKPKGDHQSTDIEIIKHLAHAGKLFAKEKLIHSYPHCWRCDTPLLNYAASSWFVKVTDIKDKLVAGNNDVSWVPEHIKEGRFGKWLEGARDWAISRQRFWGAPIPVWRCETCGEKKVISNVDDLKEVLPKAKNRYIAFRHGKADSNVVNRISSKVDNTDHLTTEGEEEVKLGADKLAKENINLIVTSDFLRTKETSAIVAERLGLSSEQIIEDVRLREIDAGELEGQNWNDHEGFFLHDQDKLDDRFPNGESLSMVRKRTTELLLDLENKYSGQTILLVTHGLPVFSLVASGEGVFDENFVETKKAFGATKRADPYEINLTLLPRNDNQGIDFHRPYIDEVKIPCACGGEMIRDKDVFDCWFESGAMPYGQQNYIGKAKDNFDPETGVGYPADFIAEGLDQTRGWFYSLAVLGTALFNKFPYKNVIVNGLVLAEDGQKMSKKLKNYPDPMLVVDRYGADALRLYMLSSPVVRSEDLSFFESGVHEVNRKIVARLDNVLNFYLTYKGGSESTASPFESHHVLDRWILSRLSETVETTDKNLSSYELDKAVRGIDDFIDDLSNWYLRRSRDRFKSEDKNDRAFAMSVTRHVLKETAKILAPFAPFISEHVFLAIRHDGDPESVHLCDWPKTGEIDPQVIEYMKIARDLVEVGLASRAKSNIKVRQPLGMIKINTDLPEEYRMIIAEEVNVKAVLFESSLAEQVELDTNITEELRIEGVARDMMREIQDARKKSGLSPEDRVKVFVPDSTQSREAVSGFESDILKATGGVSIEFSDATELTVEKVN